MMVVASAIIIIISSSIHNDDSKHFIITMISNLIEYSITEIVALYKFKTQFESNFHPKNICVDYHRRSDVRQVPRIFFVRREFINKHKVCVCVYCRKKSIFSRYLYIISHIHKSNECERATNYSSITETKSWQHMSLWDILKILECTRVLVCVCLLLIVFMCLGLRTEKTCV